MVKINEFNKQVKIPIEKRLLMDKFYYSIYPNLDKIEVMEVGGKLDKSGIDVILYFNDKSIIKVQEKSRDKDWGDFLIEFFHNSKNNLKDPWNGGVKGWYYKMGFDIMVYLVNESSVIYLINKKDLEDAVEKYQEEIRNSIWRIAYNKSYFTYNKVIKWDKIKHEKFNLK